MYQRIGKALRHALLFIGMSALAFAAHAAQPDPIEFDWAIESNQIDKVRAWLDEGLHPEYQGNSMGTGLIVAAWHGNIPMMRLFFERGANPRRVNKNGEQALQLAAWNGHLDAVKWLLDHGAVLNRESGHWSGLHYAVFNGHMEVARFLIERGANIDASSPNGSTPLMLAAREGREDMTKLLFDAGANTRPKNDWGDTALTMAIRNNNHRIGKIISTPEEFELAVRTSQQNTGESPRSEPLPKHVDEILKKIRQAQTEKKPDTIRRARSPGPTAPATANAPPRAAAPPKMIVISAKRASPGQERVRIITQAPSSSSPSSPSSSSQADRPPESWKKIADIVQQMRLAQAQGHPTDELRKQLYEALRQTK